MLRDVHAATYNVSTVAFLKKKILSRPRVRAPRNTNCLGNLNPDAVYVPVMFSCAAAVLLPGCASLVPGTPWRSSPWRAGRQQRPAVRHGSVRLIEADMKDYVRPSGPPEVRAVDGLSDLNKPVLLYLPGIELSGYTLHPQTEELAEDFSLHYLTVGQVGATHCSQLHH